jgi:carnitine O-acetyltransferase
MDGTPTLRMNEFLLASIASGKVDLGPTRVNASRLPGVEELVFELDDKVQKAIKDAEARFDELVGKHDLQVEFNFDSFPLTHSSFYFEKNKVLHYEGFGKNFTKEHKTSPDATAQLIKQLAFYKMFGRPGVTYESAQTRKYQLGRTEVIRSASKESKAWVDAMVDPQQVTPFVLL